jgi:hypothetical protein
MSVKVLIKSATTNFLPDPCSNQDLKAVSTIKYIITTIHHDDFLHPLGVEQGYIGNGLRVSTVLRNSTNHSLSNLFVTRRRSSWNLSLIIHIFKMHVWKMKSELQRNIFADFYGLVIYPKFSGHLP